MSRCENGIICGTLSTARYLCDSTAKPKVVVIPWSRWAPFAAVGHISWHKLAQPWRTLGGR